MAKTLISLHNLQKEFIDRLLKYVFFLCQMVGKAVRLLSSALKEYTV